MPRRLPRRGAAAAVRLEGRTIEVTHVLARWTEPDARLFRVRGNDGHVYVLRHNECERRCDIPEIAR